MDPERGEEFWLKQISDFDDDGDGMISFEEFESGMIRMVEDSLNSSLAVNSDDKKE